MGKSVWARIGVYIAPEDRHGAYYEEALLHAGLGFRLLESPTEDHLRGVDVLVLCGYGELREIDREQISGWVNHGGALVCSGSTWDLNGLLGLKEDTFHASNGVARPRTVDRLWPQSASWIRFFGGTLGEPGHGECVAGTDDGKAVVCRSSSGKGMAVFVGPHIGQTIALMQMGHSVETDAIGPSDRSAVLDDGKLRAEDGSNLSFDTDRAKAEGCSTPFFAYPHADYVRELLIRAVLNAVDHTGLTTSILWQWPRLAPAVAMLTLDCEDFNTDHVFRMYQLLALHGCPATWLVGRQGYPLDIYRNFRAWEHEVGCLFASDGGWHADRFKLQHVSLTRAASAKNAFAARAQDGGWRGWDAFYSMCDTTGARLSVSKGGRQPGTAGFLFGTCHPFFPRRADGTEHLTAELPYTVFIPGQVTDEAVCDEVFGTTLNVGGCFHMVLRPESVVDPAVQSAMRRLITNCRQSHMEFLKPEVLWRFEKARRTIRRAMNENEDDFQLLLIPDIAMEGLSVLFTGPQYSVETRGRLAQVQVVEKYGAKMTAVHVNLEQKQHLELRLRRLELQTAA